VPTFKQFALPDLGEGLTEGEILRWLVAPGDEVKLNQPIVEVETAKAAVEVPSPYAGVVTELHHGAGETVDVGSPIITFDVDPGGAAQESRPVVAEPGMAGSLAPKLEEKIEVLVGSGPKHGSLTRRPRKGAGPGSERPVAANAGPAHVSAPTPPIPAPARVSAAEVGAHAARVAGEGSVLAKPPVRKLARDLGVDLLTVRGSGPGGSITRDDVQTAGQRSSPIGGESPVRLTDGMVFDPATREARIPVKGVRKMTAQAMVASAFSAPHVTEFVTVDVTPTMDLLERLRVLPEFRGERVTPLLLVAKAVLVATRRTPLVNSSWDEERQEIVVKDYVNLGIAAATPRGLVVPNIPDAGRLALPDLARGITELVQVARDGKTTPAAMQHGTFTITNVGVFGIDTGTPIINPGEAAILALGAVRPTPWVHHGEIVVRQVTTLGLSFDHRIIDGQQGSAFLADVARLLADPSTFVAWS